MVEEATWLADIRALEGVKELSDPYWQHEDSIHGEDSMIAALHAGAEPMLRGVHMFFENTTKKVHSAWVLGSNVCSHPGMGHGGILMTIMDETMGTLWDRTLKSELGPGFTVNMQMDFRKPTIAGTTVYVLAELEHVEGRKAKIKGRMMDRPGGTVLLEASALFVVPKPAPTKH